MRKMNLIAMFVAVLPLSVMAQTERSVLEEVFVYGEKQQKKLSDIASSVQILDSKTLENSAIQDFNDVYAQIANVASLREGNETVFAIRGISIYGSQDNPRAYTSSVYVDDIPLNLSSIRFGGMDVWDAEQIEVFRGPQGTLQGRNSLAGAIFIKTKDPEYQWGGRAQAYYGSYGSKRLSFAGGGGIIDDVLAVRFTADGYDSDGYIDNVTRHEEDYAGFKRRSYRSKILFEPSDIVSMILTLGHLENDINSQPMSSHLNPYSRKAFSNDNDFNELSADSASLQMHIQLTDALKFSSISSLSKDKVHRYDDWDSTSIDFGYIDQNNKNELKTQELRLSFDYESVYGVTGLYLSDQKQHVSWTVDSLYPKSSVEQTALALLIANGATPVQANFIWSNIPSLIDIEGYNQADYETRNYAVFGEINIEQSEQILWTLGLRYEHEEQDYNQKVSNKVLTAVNTGNPLVDGAAAQLFNVLENAADTRRGVTYTAVLPKAAVQYFFNPRSSAAFSVQKGYRAGGSSASQLTGRLKDFDPEYTWNYELALRHRTEDQRTQFNTNVFYTDWRDQQVDVTISGDPRDTYTDNAGKSELYGIEFELKSRLARSWEMFAALGYVKTEFKEFTATEGFKVVADYKGHEFKDAPNVTAALGLMYSTGQGFYAQADVTAQNASYSNLQNTRKSDSRFLVNSKLGYRLGNINFALWVRNLLDREYTARSFKPQPIAELDGKAQDYTLTGSPRMFGLSVALDF